MSYHTSKNGTLRNTHPFYLEVPIDVIFIGVKTNWCTSTLNLFKIIVMMQEI